MTVDEVQLWVEKIAAEKGDPEAAHSDEDMLHLAVLSAIAAGADNARQLAEAVLATEKIDFARWCA